jgi:hypothetical protein
MNLMQMITYPIRGILPCLIILSSAYGSNDLEKWGHQWLNELESGCGRSDFVFRKHEQSLFVKIKQVGPQTLLKLQKKEEQGGGQSIFLDLLRDHYADFLPLHYPMAGVFAQCLKPQDLLDEILLNPKKVKNVNADVFKRYEACLYEVYKNTRSRVQKVFLSCYQKVIH